MNPRPDTLKNEVDNEVVTLLYELGRARGARIISPHFLVMDHCGQKCS